MFTIAQMMMVSTGFSLLIFAFAFIVVSLLFYVVKHFVTKLVDLIIK